MVVLATSETATSGMLAVLSYTTVTGRDMAAVLASLGEPRRHFLQRPRRISVSLPPVSSVRPKPNPPPNSTMPAATPHSIESPRAAESSENGRETSSSVNLP